MLLGDEWLEERTMAQFDSSKAADLEALLDHLQEGARLALPLAKSLGFAKVANDVQAAKHSLSCASDNANTAAANARADAASDQAPSSEVVAAFLSRSAQ